MYAEAESTSSVTDNTIKKYFAEIAKKPVLTFEEEHELFEAYKNGSKEAYEKIVESNVKLVVSIAKKFKNNYFNFADLIQEGNLGLLRAIERFDPNYGTKFSTYATLCIVQAIGLAVCENSHAIRIPSHTGEKVNKMLKARAELTNTLCRVPTDEELADELLVSKDKIQEWKSAVKTIVSLQSPYGDDEESYLQDFIIDDESEYSNVEETAVLDDLKVDVKKALDNLTDQQYHVVVNRIGLYNDCPKKLEEIAKEMGVTSERVRQIQVESYKTLRKAANAKYISCYVTDDDISSCSMRIKLDKRRRELELDQAKRRAVLSTNEDGKFIFNENERDILVELSELNSKPNAINRMKSICKFYGISLPDLVKLNHRYSEKFKEEVGKADPKLSTNYKRVRK